MPDASAGSISYGPARALAVVRALPLWAIPMVYTVASVTAGLILPRLEHAYLGAYTHEMSVGSALAFFSAVASGMMAFTAIVFAVAFVVVQFSAGAYSPRLVTMFASKPALYHTLGVFFATFTYALAALVWTDREGGGTTPPVSTYLVGVLLLISMLAFARLIQSVNDLQIHNVLQAIGSHGRTVIGAMYPIVEGSDAPQGAAAPLSLSPATQTLSYSGEPRVVAALDQQALVGLAERADAVVAVECAVGETLMQDSVLLRVHGGILPEMELRRAVRLAAARTFEQDPKYALRLLVDVAIRALSPAVNDPTTAVQALDQIEDLLRRLGRRRLASGYVRDTGGAVRLTFPAPTWEDYLALAFDEIRQFGATSLQVDRRLRAALVDLVDTVSSEARRATVRRYLAHLDEGTRRSAFDDEDRVSALQIDRGGLGLPRTRSAPLNHKPGNSDAKS